MFMARSFESICNNKRRAVSLIVDCARFKNFAQSTTFFVLHHILINSYRMMMVIFEKINNLLMQRNHLKKDVMLLNFLNINQNNFDLNYLHKRWNNSRFL
jgi:hypothetical protein